METPWKLETYENLPNYLKQNEYIRFNHRPQLHSIKECLKSIFKLHTETFNIWTHLSATTIMIILYVRHLYYGHDLIDKFLYTLFFGGHITCFAISTIYHTFLCYSNYAAWILTHFDYFGVTFSIIFSWTPVVYYGFCGNLTPICFHAFLGLCLLNFGTRSILSNKFVGTSFAWRRISVFFSFGLISIFVFAHIYFTRKQPELIPLKRFFIPMGLFFYGGGIVYGLKFPEKYFPGKFDIFGQSHQIMHIAVFMGTICCYLGSLQLQSFYYENMN